MEQAESRTIRSFFANMAPSLQFYMEGRKTPAGAMAPQEREMRMKARELHREKELE